jgi:autoinducer 2-degrading protein
MYVTIVHVHVKTDHIDDFIQATRTNHLASIQEDGNRRFDILQQADDPGRFVLYEAYTDAQKAAAHKDTAHYRQWRNDVANWMASPRQGIVYTGLFPNQAPVCQ